MTHADPSSVEAFRRDGAVPIRGLLSGEQVETLRKGIERNRAEPGPLAQGHGAFARSSWTSACGSGFRITSP